MWVRSDQRVMLRQNGLKRFADFMTCEGGEVVNLHAWREVRRLELDGDDGGRTVFLKRFGPIHLKDALKDLLRFRRVRTRALIEFEMLYAFKRAGITVPETLACGERHVLGRDRASFLMIERLRAGRPLDETLRELDDVHRRRRLITSLAEFVRGMHDAGLRHKGLFAKHLFVEEQPDGSWTTAVIDLQQAGESRAVSSRRRGRDLASLMVSLLPDATTPREQWTFLLRYLDKSKLTRKDLRFVRRGVLPHARKLSRRTAYRAWQPILEQTKA